jgi:hypothetical protein
MQRPGLCCLPLKYSVKSTDGLHGVQFETPCRLWWCQEAWVFSERMHGIGRDRSQFFEPDSTEGSVPPRDSPVRLARFNGCDSCFESRRDELGVQRQQATTGVGH